MCFIEQRFTITLIDRWVTKNEVKKEVSGISRVTVVKYLVCKIQICNEEVQNVIVASDTLMERSGKKVCGYMD